MDIDCRVRYYRNQIKKTTTETPERSKSVRNLRKNHRMITNTS